MSFIYDFGVYNDRVFHLTKLELIFQHLDGSRVILNLKKIIFQREDGWTYCVKKWGSHGS
jgi:hypothetical protein